MSCISLLVALSLHVGLDETNLTISIKTASNLYITKI